MKLFIPYITQFVILISFCQQVISATSVCSPYDNSCDQLILSEGPNCPDCKMGMVLKTEGPTSLSEVEKIKQLLSKYESEKNPGFAVGVFRNGETVFAQGYGLANLDELIPNTATSKFYIGSMAKQFCGAALLKLKSEGKIDFSKPIQTYLPDFPSYEHPITVDHIIHHTSGIRCTSSMQLIAGVDQNFEETFTAEEQYQLILNQIELNFQPGSEYRYSSGGYILLAKVVEAISGLSFREYLKTHLFDPLGMYDTFVIDDHQEVVRKRVISYWPDENGIFKRRSMVFDGMGDGSILTTIEDLAKWDRAFYDDSLLGIPNFADMMYQNGRLNSGQEVNYGMALSTYEQNGHRMIAHNGGMLGFSADLIRFPEKQISVAVLCNLGGLYSTGIAQEIAEIFLPKKTKKEVIDSSAELSFEPTLPEAKKFAGKYFSTELNNWWRISFANDTLFFDAGDLKYRSPIFAVNDSLFATAGKNQLYFQFSSGGKLKVSNETMNRERFRFDDTLPESLRELKDKEGRYYSSEMNTYYRFYEEEGRFMVQVNNDLPITIYPSASDERINWNSKDMVWLGYAMVRFQRNTHGQIEGFHIGDNRVNGVWFERRFE